jgi:hypothetical protein
MRGTVKQLIPYMLELDDTKIYEVKEYKEKRNLDQNAKYWKLLNELALTLKVGVEELHFKMLKDYSQRYEILVPKDIKLRGIDYYEKKSKIIRNGQEFIVYQIFTPSHELNTREFALLLQGLCDECKEQGIETLSPNELKKLEEMIRG